MDDSLLYRMALAGLRLKPEAARRLLARAGDERGVFSSDLSALGARNLPRGLQTPASRERTLAEAEAELRFVAENGIRTLYFTDPDYPRRLLQCPDAPLMLFALGGCDLNGSRVVSTVGTRHATVYGEHMTQRLVQELGRSMADPLVVVSGLAFGIDVAAHRACLAQGVPTVAVMARGLNAIYPPEHRDVAARIAQGGGMLLTEYRSTDPVHKGNFLARNRIIAGLSDCTVIVESSEKGGALHTARLALEYDREVMAVPGRVTDPYSRGCNRLIAGDRAHMLDCPGDLLALMGWPARAHEGTQGELPLELTAEEGAVLRILDMRGDVTAADMGEILGVEQARLSATLVKMEFRGLLTALPGGRYRREV